MIGQKRIQLTGIGMGFDFVVTRVKEKLWKRSSAMNCGPQEGEGAAMFS